MWSRQPPVNVRGVDERHKIVRQTDSGLGVDAQEGPGGFPQGLILPLPIRPLTRDLCHGWDSPCWLPALCPFLFSVSQFGITNMNMLLRATELGS